MNHIQIEINDTQRAQISIREFNDEIEAMKYVDKFEYFKDSDRYGVRIRNLYKSREWNTLRWMLDRNDE